MFAQQVRSEVSKIVWTTRRDLLVTTLLVFLMATIASIFFFLIDQIIRLGLTSLLGLF
ncbi:MAG: preprotein translocase subunit SecE [Rhodobacteraceae bacterium]|nr:preprotein translocase subunit SecE [Paracoccaceae bacterium]